MIGWMNQEYSFITDFFNEHICGYPIRRAKMIRNGYESLYVIYILNYSIAMDCPVIEIKTTSSWICAAAEMCEYNQLHANYPLISSWKQRRRPNVLQYILLTLQMKGQ